MFGIVKLNVRDIFTENLRIYLGKYQEENKVSRVTIDNVRRILSSFFAWLEDEDYIVKSPVRRIHKVKTAKIIKEAFTDETIEILRDTCNEVRNLAIVELLDSSGMRVGELVKLNRTDINFNERSCIVLAKEAASAKYILTPEQKFTYGNICIIEQMITPLCLFLYALRMNELQ